MNVKATEGAAESSPGYERPALKVVGSVYMLTLAGDQFCVPGFNKTIGNPDFLHFIPIANCS